MPIVMIRIGAGHLTTRAPTLRHPRIRCARLGSSVLPKRVATEITAAPSVNAAATTTTMPMASGIPRVWKYGRFVKCRQNVAPAMVKPEPSTTCAVPRYIV